MKKMLILAAILMAAALLATAQEMPRLEVFGGYSYLNVGSSGQQNGFGLNGWNAQASVNLTNWLGVTGDFGGYYGSPFAVSIHNYSYMFGPTLSYRAQRVVPFAHALFGGGHVSGSIGGLSSSQNAFAMAVGGGVDIPVKGHFRPPPGASGLDEDPVFQHQPEWLTGVDRSDAPLLKYP